MLNPYESPNAVNDIERQQPARSPQLRVLALAGVLLSMAAACLVAPLTSIMPSTFLSNQDAWLVRAGIGLAGGLLVVAGSRFGSKSLADED